MRVFLLCTLCVFSLARAYADQTSQQELYQEFVQIDAQIESLLKQKLGLKAELAQHVQREQESIRPRVDRRQDAAIEDLSQQIQSLSLQIEELDEKRSNILLRLE